MKIDIILDPDTAPIEARELGLLAESYGINAVWASNYPSSRDPFITLAPLALASSRIRVGPLVITPWELHPLKISKAILGLNELSNGRANILIGGPTGVPGTMGISPLRMVGHVKESVEILKAVRADKALNYQGRIFQVWGYRPAWAGGEPPFIYVAANKEQMLAMATKIADGIMLGDMTLPRMQAAMTMIDQGLAAAGRRRADIRLSSLMAWHVKEDERESVAEARQQLALRGMLDAWYLDSFLSAEECRFVDEHRDAFFRAYKTKTAVIDGVPDAIINKIIDNLSCTGGVDSVDRHIKRLRRFRDLGLTDLALKLHRDQAAAIRLIGERVVPGLAE